nr:hypothetical protein [Kibdelosporangium sp. MJ126-NF4]
MLYEHKVLTTNQIIDLAFPSRRSANLRLRLLDEWGIVYRFQPHREFGSHPMHYVLDTPGATILAYEAGITPRNMPYSRRDVARHAYSLQLAHDVACNGLFTSLVRHARQPRTTGQLTTWWSASHCKRLWGDIVKPDGYARWSHDGREFDWFMEFDFGTEPRSRILDKVDRYTKLATNTGLTTPVLLWFPTPDRESSVRYTLQELHNELSQPNRVPIATTNSYTAEDSLDMSTARWLPVGPGLTPDRVPFTELTTLWPDIPEPEPLDDHEDSYLTAPSPMPPPDLEYRKPTAA